MPRPHISTTLCWLLTGCNLGLSSIVRDTGPRDGAGADGGGSAGDGGESTDGGADGGSISDGGSSDASRPPEPGDLVITEILAAPNAVAEADGEWFEIFNASSHTLLLSGMDVQDEGSDAFTLPTSKTIELEAGRYGAICRNDDFDENGGVFCLWSWDEIDPDLMQFTSSDDEVLLYYEGEPLDRVEWDTTWGFAEGKAKGVRENKQTTTDNDSPSNWCDQTSTLEQGDLGTPGEPNDDC